MERPEMVRENSHRVGTCLGTDRIRANADGVLRRAILAGCRRSGILPRRYCLPNPLVHQPGSRTRLGRTGDGDSLLPGAGCPNLRDPIENRMARTGGMEMAFSA